MAWNLTVCNPPSVNTMSNKNRGEQVLDMVSQQVSSSIRCCYISPQMTGDGLGTIIGSPKRNHYSAFDPQEDGGEDDVIEDNSHPAEKKRRLTSEQVKFLELSFEVENKLEPERKVVIAKQLGLQPRQVAVWFQNRRARWKAKRLERDYETLRANFDAIMKENETLHAEVGRLSALLNSDCKKQGRSSDPLFKNKSSHDTASLHTTDVHVQHPVDEHETVDDCVTDMPELESPSKSDGSEVLNSVNFTAGVSDQKGVVSPLLMIQDSTSLPGGAEEVFRNVYNPLLLQHVAVKLETALFSEDNCNLFFSWEDHGMFPWCD